MQRWRQRLRASSTCRWSRSNTGLRPNTPGPPRPKIAKRRRAGSPSMAQALGREFTGIVLCGDSAGGTLTLVTGLALRDRPAALPVLMQMADLSGERQPETAHRPTQFGGSDFGLDAREHCLLRSGLCARSQRLARLAAKVAIWPDCRPPCWSPPGSIRCAMKAAHYAAKCNRGRGAGDLPGSTAAPSTAASPSARRSPRRRPILRK